MPTITLSGATYRVVLTTNGKPVVIVRRSERMCRIAPADMTSRVLAGFTLKVMK